MQNDDDKIIIYTDGACSGNPGNGGYGAILFYKDFKKNFLELEVRLKPMHIQKRNQTKTKITL